MNESLPSAYQARIEFVAVAHPQESAESTLLGVFATFAAAHVVADQWLRKSAELGYEVSIAECEVGRAYLHDSAPRTKRFALRTQLVEVSQ